MGVSGASGAWAAACAHRKLNMLRRTHYDQVPLKPQRHDESCHFGDQPHGVALSEMPLGKNDGRVPVARVGGHIHRQHLARDVEAHVLGKGEIEGLALRQTGAAGLTAFVLVTEAIFMRCH